MVTEQQPDQKEALLTEARAALAKGDLQRAVELYKKLVSDFKDTDEAQQAEEFLSMLRSPSSRAEMGPLSTLPFVAIGLGFWGLIGIGVAALIGNKWAKNFLSTHWLLMICLLIGGIALAYLLTRLATYLARVQEGTRRAVYAFGVVPIILTLLIGVVFLTVSYQAFVFEIVFILVVCIIPAAAYYLFLSTRRPSILNEFIGNLSRLGLLEVRHARQTDRAHTMGTLKFESGEERHARIESYFQRFEALYGELRFDGGRGVEVSRRDFVDSLIRAVDRSRDEGLPERSSMPQAMVRITDMFRANLIIPLGLATVLTALGWLLVMQPAWIPHVQAPQENAGQQKEGPSSENPGAKTSNESKSKNVPKAPPVPASGGESPQPNKKKTQTGFQVADWSVVRLTPVLNPVNFAFLGAYFFGLQMLFRRFARRDLGPNAYLAFTNRIVLAVIAVWVAILCYELLNSGNVDNWSGMLASGTLPNWPPILLVLSFVVGVFPRVLWQFITALIAKGFFLRIVIPSIEQKQPLSQLDGLTVWHESRLEEEDVENVPNMATVDVVDIMLHTQIPAERLIVWIDQAILYSVLGPKESDNSEDKGVAAKLRKLGPRNASQIVEAYNADGPTRESLESVLGADKVHTIVHALQIEANFDLVRAWRRV